MINISEIPEELIKIEIKMHLPRDNIFEFLQKKGYHMKKWLWEYQDETFPGGITNYESWTFTATKPGEIQSENTLFLKVFETEFKELLKEL